MVKSRGGKGCRKGGTKAPAWDADDAEDEEYKQEEPPQASVVARFSTVSTTFLNFCLPLNWEHNNRDCSKWISALIRRDASVGISDLGTFSYTKNEIDDLNTRLAIAIKGVLGAVGSGAFDYDPSADYDGSDWELEDSVIFVSEQHCTGNGLLEKNYSIITDIASLRKLYNEHDFACVRPYVTMICSSRMSSSGDMRRGRPPRLLPLPTM